MAFEPKIASDLSAIPNGKTHLEDMVINGMFEEPVSTGTTIMALEFDGGVVVGADSRTTSGSFIANRVTDKLTKITDQIYVCRSGSAADTQAIADVVAYHLDFYQMETGEPALVPIAANLFRDMCYNYRDSITAGIICAGWDRRYGPQVYTIPLGGMVVRQPVSIGGSGSTYIYGYVDSQYRPGMNKEECCQLVTNALSLAMARDGSSGGVARLAIITEQGVERRVTLSGDLPKFHEG
ncbi:proteasome beta1 subunit [Dermatophagoides farinae]|uniref:Proteasome subunit beta n=1 Tax=Dermatophagoides farinae TaxID=6954 RepID=A0A922HRX2_DERFA|nr:proteasome subunit beta type-6-like [Dermatophagoides farinae]KAH7636910.1 proteasome subunit beta type-6-like protein [Dermatophagoides farinae]KAH9506556.1 Proteasome subunit beta type-6 [Dermatophagoides farinae]